MNNEGKKKTKSSSEVTESSAPFESKICIISNCLFNTDSINIVLPVLCVKFQFFIH